MRIFILVSFLCMLSASNAFSEELKRTPEGVQVAQDNYLNIPADMQVRKVANNVITPEDDVVYIARKLEEQNQRLQEMASKLQAIDTRLKALEATG